MSTSVFIFNQDCGVPTKQDEKTAEPLKALIVELGAAGHQL